MGNLIFLLVIVVIFGVMISAQRRRQRAAMQVQHEILPGSRIMTTAGLFATVVSVGDDEVELEVAPGVVSRYARAAIARVIPPGADGSHDALNGEEPDSPFGEDNR